MAERKRTPGPWLVAKPKRADQGQQGDRLIYTQDGRHIAEVFQYQNHEHRMEFNEADGNALLIAAAPALLAAAKAIQGHVAGAIGEQLDAAIAAAEEGNE
jgi:hypothetical protein